MTSFADESGRDASERGSGDLRIPDWPPLDPDVADVLKRMTQDGSWGRYHGPHCERLRSALSDFHEVDHTLLCSSGTAAIELALRAAGVQSGDEVILAAYDYKANFANVLTLGARPVLVDALPGLPVMDIGQLEGALTERTRAVIVSHLHGSFGPIREAMAIAEATGLTVLEDACQAPGAILNGQRVGSIGHVGALSFGGSKLLTAGRGGVVLTKDPQLAQRIRLHTQRGNDAYPLSEMQAAVLLPQLKKLDARNRHRQTSVRAFLQELETTSLMPALAPVGEKDLPSFYKVAFQLAEDLSDEAALSVRDSLSQAARRAGIALDAAFPALHLIHARRRFRMARELPRATALHHRLMTLHHPLLLQEIGEVQAAARRLNVVCSSA